MNTNSNPKLLKTVISGHGIKFPRTPGVIIGNKLNGYIQGDLMDANAIDEFTTSRISIAKKEVVSDILQQLADGGIGDLKDAIGQIVDNKVAEAVASIMSNPETADIDSIEELVDAINQKTDSAGHWFSVSDDQLVLNINS